MRDEAKGTVDSLEEGAEDNTTSRTEKKAERKRKGISRFLQLLKNVHTEYETDRIGHLFDHNLLNRGFVRLEFLAHCWHLRLRRTPPLAVLVLLHPILPVVS